MLNSFHKQIFGFILHLKPFCGTDIDSSIFIYTYLGKVCILSICSGDICIPCVLVRLKPQLLHLRARGNLKLKMNSAAPASAPAPLLAPSQHPPATAPTFIPSYNSSFWEFFA